MSTCQPYKLQCASTVYMAIYVTVVQVYKTTRYLLVKKAAHLHYTQASFNQQVSCSFIDLYHCNIDSHIYYTSTL